jgi:hypothetical protein
MGGDRILTKEFFDFDSLQPPPTVSGVWRHTIIMDYAVTRREPDEKVHTSATFEFKGNTNGREF